MAIPSRPSRRNPQTLKKAAKNDAEWKKYEKNLKGFETDLKDISSID
ncbi:hypothetical protein [Sedimentitalea nanhaiensis]|uniref:Uncharacterized protein n=1 Tax=Sedimentitalea nanhaiensis TaxID=999627 RepID=A0A1I7DCV2_9RHOB|nr:hypothetical protein [Sedimentitalea nanhaiensis]SFU09518.1 hypothetical protein SAMN05216236_12618 [Sedimentitalea nanhaiensis]